MLSLSSKPIADLILGFNFLRLENGLLLDDEPEKPASKRHPCFLRTSRYSCMK